MSDRFKFRAWDKSKNVVVYDIENCFDDWECQNFYDYIAKDRYIVEQCTGVKDKNGKLIYEGDIVQMSYPYSSNKYIVKWGDCCWELWLENGFVYVVYEKMILSMEVISNIHENADLLENEE